jgi:hypothetical protein
MAARPGIVIIKRASTVEIHNHYYSPGQVPSSSKTSRTSMLAAGEEKESAPKAPTSPRVKESPLVHPKDPSTVSVESLQKRLNALVADKEDDDDCKTDRIMENDEELEPEQEKGFLTPERQPASTTMSAGATLWLGEECISPQSCAEPTVSDSAAEGVHLDS